MFGEESAASQSHRRSITSTTVLAFNISLTTFACPFSFAPHSSPRYSLTTMSTLLPPTTSSPPPQPPSPTQLTVPSVQPEDPGLPPEDVPLGPSKPYLTAPLSYLHPFPGRIPPEICDEIIDELRDDTWSLRACALTCHDWHFRSRIHLFRNVHISESFLKQTDFDEFCSCLTSHPSLAPLVQSIVIYGNPLSMNFLRQLPNLRRMKLVINRNESISFHTKLLAYFHAHLHIETLTLYGTKLSSLRQLSSLILSLRSLTHLVCTDIELQDKEIIEATGKINFRERTKLRHLEVSISEL